VATTAAWCATRAPGRRALELCNGIDDNCNGQADEGFALGDLNGDSQLDLVTGDWLAAGTEIESGCRRVLGNGGRLGPSRSQPIVNPQAQREGWFGTTVVLYD
jgi:hypothetical protein